MMAIFPGAPLLISMVAVVLGDMLLFVTMGMFLGAK